jgi:hypothetical protein
MLARHLPPIRHTGQNVKPMRATRDRGCRKCVPLKVDKKLYSATLLVRLATSNEPVNFSCFSNDGVAPHVGRVD